MCLNPRKILNPSLSWHIGMPKYIVCRCGVCSECRAQKQQEWYLRDVEEFRNCRNGSNFFVTLTFRNSDLPFYEDIRDFEYKTEYQYVNTPDRTDIYEIPKKVKKSVMYRFPCFDSSLITSFIKKFRVYLSRKYPNHDTSGLKFLVCPEFGKNTQRQHFHVNIHSPFFIPVSDFKEICRKAWTHGWIGASKTKGFLVKSESASQYTSKYVNKDLYFYNGAMNKYLDKESLDPAEYRYRYEKVKSFLPRVRVSQHFGASMAERIRKRPDVLDFICQPRPIQRLSKSGKPIFYPIPSYIMSLLTRKIDKYTSELVGKPVYTYTDLGKKLRKELFLSRLVLDKIKLEQFKSSQYIKDTLSRKDFSNERKMRSHIATRLPQLLRDLSLRDLVFYRRFLRFLPVEKYGKHSAFWYNRRFEQIIDDYFGTRSIPLEFYGASKYRFDMISPDSLLSPYFKLHELGVPLKSFNYKDVKVLSDLGEFVLYEEACNLIDIYYSMHSRQRSKIIDARNDRVDDVRDQCVDFILYESAVSA